MGGMQPFHEVSMDAPTIIPLNASHHQIYWDGSGEEGVKGGIIQVYLCPHVDHAPPRIWGREDCSLSMLEWEAACFSLPEMEKKFSTHYVEASPACLSMIIWIVVLHTSIPSS